MAAGKAATSSAKSKGKSLQATSAGKVSGKASSKPKAKSTLSAEELGQLVKKTPGLLELLLQSSMNASDEAAQEARRTAHRRRQPIRAASPAVDDGEDDEEGADDDAGMNEEDQRAVSDGDVSGADSGAAGEEYQDEDSCDPDEDEYAYIHDTPLKHKRPPKRPSSSNREQHPAKRPRLEKAGDADPSVSIGRSVTLLRPLARPRGEQSTGATPAIPPASVQPVTPVAPPSTPRRSSAATAANDASAAPATAAPFTPYVPRANPKKTRQTLEGLLTDSTQDVLRALKGIYRVYILTENGFPTLAETQTFVNDRLLDVLRAGAKKNRVGRADDKAYQYHLAKLLYGKASDIRNHLVAIAKGVAVEYYKLDGFKGRDRRKEVSRLTANAAFVYSDTKKLEGLFEHPAIRTVVQKAIFSSSKPAFNLARVDEYKSHFDPFPRKLLALAAVALWCALDQWKHGSFEQVDFKRDAYIARYERLQSKISDTVDGEPDLEDYFAVLCSGWYAEARDAAGLFDSESDSDTSADDEDVITRNREAMRAAARTAQAARAAQEGGAGSQGGAGSGANTDRA